MKRVLLILSLLIATTPVAIKAQISVTHRETPKATEAKVEPYDSTKNFLRRKNVPSYVGQVLYVKGLPDNIRKRGYADFRTTQQPAQNKDIYGIPAPDSPSNTRYEDLAEKSFIVTNVEPDKRAHDRYFPSDRYYWFRLQNKEDENDIVWFQYDGDHERSFPFVVMSYYNYLSNTFKGKKYVLSYNGNGNDIITPIIATDFNTGETIIQNKKDRWECIDITIDDRTYNLCVLLKNQKGNITSIDPPYMLTSIGNGIHKIFEEKEFNALVKKYGSSIMDCVRQGIGCVGMTETLLLMAKGEPDTINHASYGDQWCYGNNYYYFENGKLTAWN